MSTLAINSSYPAPRRVAAKPVARARPKLVVVAPRELAPRQDHSPRANKLGIGALFGVATLLHVGVMLAVQQSAHAPAPVVVTQPLALDFAPPPPPPPPEPPKPQPQVAKAPAPVKAAPVLPVVSEPVSDGPASADTVQVATEPQPAPVSAPAPAPAPPPPAPEPVSEPRGFAGYLKNPAPEYPLQAQERGQQGRVILKVHVLASGKPDSVTVDKSTGFKILDDAAVKAVLSWSFDPAKRGSTPIDGWVKVPLSFTL